jgi:carotenoid cleavage dioxygenase
LLLGTKTGSPPKTFSPRSWSIVDEGWIMAIVFDKNINKSKLIIVDVENFDKKPVCEVILPQRVPFGAHGSWLSN